MTHRMTHKSTTQKPTTQKPTHKSTTHKSTTHKSTTHKPTHKPTQKPFAVGSRVAHVVIDGVDDEGRGRGVVDVDGVDIDVAVRGACVGDVVDDAVVEVAWPQRGLVQARPGRLTPGPLHDERRCGHKGPCAACPLHGVDASFVAALKRERVRQAFGEAGVDVDGRLAPLLRGEGLRQKVKLVAYGAPGRVRLGHYVPHTHEPAPALLCGVVRPALQAALVSLCAALDDARIGPPMLKAVIAREFASEFNRSRSAQAVELTDDSAADASEFASSVGVVLVGDGSGGIDVDAVCARVCAAAGLAGVAWRDADAQGSANSLVSGQVRAQAGAALLTPLDGGPACAVDAFCQADVRGAARLVDAAADFVVDVDGVDAHADAVYADLYAGTGAFARALVARGAAHVFAVEVAAVSVRTLSTLPRVEAFLGTVASALPAVRAALGTRTLAGLVVDPPQKGLRDDVSAVLALGAARIAVVSCDVDAGARDVRAFVDGGYDIVGVVPVDLFPGSSEVEVLTLLRKRG